MAERAKTQRANKRRRLTNLKKKFDDMAKADIHTLFPERIDKLKKDVAEEIKLHQEFQDDFERLLAEDTTERGVTAYEAEVASGEENFELYSQWIWDIGDLLYICEAAHEVQGLKAKYARWRDTHKVDSETFLADSGNLLTVLEAYLDKTQPRAADPRIAKERDELEAGIRDIKTKLSLVKKSAPAAAVVKRSSDYQTKFNLIPPSFHGEPGKWANFHKLFTSTIEKRGADLSDEEKKCILLDAMKTPELKSLVELQVKMENGYERALAALERKYGSLDVLIPEMIKTIFKSSSFAYSSKGIEELLTQFYVPYQQLAECKADLSTVLFYVAISMSDDKLKEGWAEHSRGDKELPTLEKLRDYLEPLGHQLNVKGASAILPSYSSSSPSSSHARSKPSPKPKSAASGKGAYDSPGPKKCILCHEIVHSLTRCPVFLGYDINQRNQFVNDNKWCKNCLHPSHNVRDCTSSGTCRSCNGKHHTMLHRDRPGQAPARPAGAVKADTGLRVTDAFTKPHVEDPVRSFLDTAIVVASNGCWNRKVRILLDSGSGVSLITEAMATHLKLNRNSQMLRLSGPYAQGYSKQFAKLKLTSIQDATQSAEFKFSIVQKLPSSTRPNHGAKLLRDICGKGYKLADTYFGGPIDAIIGRWDFNKCLLELPQVLEEEKIAITNTLFGHTVSGSLADGQTGNIYNVQAIQDDLQQSLEKLYELDKVPEIVTQSDDDQSAVCQFYDHLRIQDDGRYQVKLPRTSNPPVLGTSRKVAISRFHSNERSLRKKGKLEDFNVALAEYPAMDHAEKVPAETTVSVHQSYYLPVHGVFKDTSSTTKVRPVFDASAKTSTGVSFNDTLLTGPNLYPLLPDVLIRFRKHPIGMSADISKMFREILLDPEDRDFHRFFMRDESGNMSEYRMKRLTFGVKPSPFVATQVLRDLASKHQLEFPLAANAILHDFYVDDFLSGADSVDLAHKIQIQLCALLLNGGMKLRKWRVSDESLLSRIPPDLRETEPLHIQSYSETPKALGIHWDVKSDYLRISAPVYSTTGPVTKRIIASETAKVFDVLGLFSPYIVAARVIFQKTWKIDVDWDDELPDDLREQWFTWAEELPSITKFAIPRRYVNTSAILLESSLHGFADASTVAYGCAVYLRQVFSDGSIHTALVIAKARVAPVKATLTIPKAELVAAYMLHQLLLYTAKVLNIDQSYLHAWSDSTIVLQWLRKAPSTLRPFVANRVAVIQKSSGITWHHVKTDENPADLASRGVSAKALADSKLWWEGPSWLREVPTTWKKEVIQPHTILPEVRVTVGFSVVSKRKVPEGKKSMWIRFSCFDRLVRVMSWVRRFFRQLKSKVGERNPKTWLSCEEVLSTRLLLFKIAQRQTYEPIIQALEKGKAPPVNHRLHHLDTSLDDQGLLRVSGRVRSQGGGAPKKLIALSLDSIIVKIFIQSSHHLHLHTGISAHIAILNEEYHIPKLRKFLQTVSKACARCQHAYANPIQPKMGRLPAERTEPSPPFAITGVDFAGPFQIRESHTRKPVFIKAYAAVFVCFTTKAIHLELCSNLSAESFMAAFKRFHNRRGLPHQVYSDNGTNFVGTARELREMDEMIHEAKDSISHLCSAHGLKWHFSPPRAPNFGGLWEAGVKAMKLYLKKLVSPHPLRYAELETILIEAESILNSRPIIPLNSTELDTDFVLTPGHFLIGRPLRTVPRTPETTHLSALKRWQLVERLTQDLWQRWSAHYLQTLIARRKWHRDCHEVQEGDLVVVQDETLMTTLRHPIAKIIRIYPGDDGATRAVDILCGDQVYRRRLSQLVLLFQKEQPIDEDLHDIEDLYHPTDQQISQRGPPGSMFRSEQGTPRPKTPTGKGRQDYDPEH